MTIYECEHCETALGPGLLACPRCGQAFDEPVPADASVPDERETFPPSQAFEDLPPASPRRATLFPRLAAGLTAVLLLLGLFWLGVRFLRPSAPPAESRAAPLLTDLQAHPAYPAAMASFVGSLHAAGVEAQWPAFGSSDTLLIMPPASIHGQRALWNADLDKRLAQGIYGSFWERRYETGFSDSDSTTCFVLVCDQSGKIVAVDLMGNVE